MLHRLSVPPTITSNEAALAALWQAEWPDATGKITSLRSHRGHVTVVNFWASWCASCVAEVPELSALQREYAAKDVHFVGIAVDSVDNVANFMKMAKVDYPIYIAGFDGIDWVHRLGDEQGALPFTLLIDTSGKVRSSWLGRLSTEKLRQCLNEVVS
jgi:thiol-disulfide isomerase/thioredoxin